MERQKNAKGEKEPNQTAHYRKVGNLIIPCKIR